MITAPVDSAPPDTSSTRDPRWRAASVAPLALAAVVSVVVIAWPRPALWLDEAQSVAIAHRSLPGIVDALRADGAPPIYYVVLHVWMSVFGTGDTAVRSLSITGSWTRVRRCSASSVRRVVPAGPPPARARCTSTRAARSTAN